VTLRISCIVVCYNQENTIADAVLSLVRQTRPPDEIVVADDASSDGSRDVIRTLANSHRLIRPILRETNLGVSANRDLAVRDATGHLITALDGDDFVLPTKIQRECEAMQRSSCAIAYSVQRFSDEARRKSWLAKLPPMHQLDAPERLRSLLSGTHTPLGMLVPKDIHLAIGGYRHELRVYEDWDYKIRLAAAPYTWVDSGVEGVVVRVHGDDGTGLSNIPHYRHALARLTVLKANRALIHDRLGKATYYTAAGRIIAKSAKWQSMESYWRIREKVDDVLRSRSRS
jgi:glycosyltransferase involved in cell wall biosynthesis